MVSHQCQSECSGHFEFWRLAAVRRRRPSVGDGEGEAELCAHAFRGFFRRLRRHGLRHALHTSIPGCIHSYKLLHRTVLYGSHTGNLQDPQRNFHAGSDGRKLYGDGVEPVRDSRYQRSGDRNRNCACRFNARVHVRHRLELRGNSAGPFGGPALGTNSSRDFAVPQSACGIPASARAYSLNVTVVPLGPLGFVSVWPTGLDQPTVSTLNSSDGRVKANAALVPRGINGAVTVFASHPTHAILDINGYFVPASGVQDLAFYPVTPCRLADTRAGTGTFAGPALASSVPRTFPVTSGACGIPQNAQAYAMNMTVVPAGGLGFLTAWPAGSPQPGSSTLNAPTGTVTSNLAIVPAGVNGGISVLATHQTDLVIDITGYFAPPGGVGALDFYTATPCRILDTRGAVGLFCGPQMLSGASRSFAVPSSPCGIPSNAKAYSLNATVVPPAPLGLLTLWGGGSMPGVSTLNSYDGSIVANAALIPAGTNAVVTAFTSNATDLILDVNGYFR